MSVKGFNDIIGKVEVDKWYKNWKSVCNDVGLDYKKYRIGNRKIHLMNQLQNYYNIEKDGYMMKFIPLYDDVVSVAEVDEEIDRVFENGHIELSKYFQVSLINYLSEKMKVDAVPTTVMSMGYMLKSFDIVDKSNSKLYDDRLDYHYEYINSYGYAMRTRANSLYVNGLDNLQRKGFIKYNKSHNITFKVAIENEKLKKKYYDKDELKRANLKIFTHTLSERDLYDYDYYIRDEYHHVFATNELETAILNGRANAWELMCDIFGFNDNKSKNINVRINYFSLNNRVGGLWFKKNKPEKMIEFENRLNEREYQLLVRFFNDYNYSYYNMYYDLSKIMIGKCIERYCNYEIPAGYNVYVDYYYTAYQIHYNRIAIDRYKDKLIENILNGDELQGKHLNIEYMAKHVYNQIDKDKIKEYFFKDDNGHHKNIPKSINDLSVQLEIIENVLRLCMYMIHPQYNNEIDIDFYSKEIFGDVIDEYKSKI